MGSTTQACVGQQLADQRVEIGDLALEILQRGIVGAAIPQQLDQHPQVSERRPDLVGHRGQQRARLCELGLDAGGHVVERDTDHRRLAPQLHRATGRALPPARRRA